jgi:Flp pilus assembly pilin Flp
MKRWLQRPRPGRQGGQSLVEYALILVLVAVVVVTVLAGVGRQITAIFTHITTALSGGG